MSESAQKHTVHNNNISPPWGKSANQGNFVRFADTDCIKHKKPAATYVRVCFEGLALYYYEFA